ncbi:seryl-tRNA synthetase [Ephemerocybe angulata]|uniref:serine--tRNA ligase n=1 Tax=Ephemerocybe angulata TaxID=980116 RepID=A0A8H6IL38_9AGAR|nr:seryl-tRNA synthetase [Tulosesus angulatus]
MSCHLRPFCRALSVQRHSAKNLCRRHKSSAAAGASVSELPPPRLDYRSLAENLEQTIQNAKARNAPVSQGDIAAVARMYAEANDVSKQLNARRHLQSQIGDKIRKAASDEERTKAREEATSLKQEVHALQTKLQTLERTYQQFALHIPNDTHPQTPIGPEPAASIIATHGPAFIPADPKRDHVAIAKELDLLDLESGATVTGSSWYFLKNEAALLEMALTNYSMSIAMKHGFTPVTTPDVIRSDIAVRCGFQPRDAATTGEEVPVSHMYHITPNHESAPQLILSGTAEIPLAGMFANKVYNEAALPLKYVGVGHAFRQEAGARSADTRGLYRVHQFTKVELFGVSTETQSEEMMETMKDIQIEILSGLNLSFRVLDMPSEELGASAYRKYDMEAWMPGRGTWGEVSSLSNCTDFQSRRLHIRYRPQEKKGAVEGQTRLPFAHTLNGTAAAVPRLIVALLENGAMLGEDGVVEGLRLPVALKPFWFAPESNRILVEWQEGE